MTTGSFKIEISQVNRSPTEVFLCLKLTFLSQNFSFWRILKLS
jgi:hypothetical protein